MLHEAALVSKRRACLRLTLLKFRSLNMGIKFAFAGAVMETEQRIRELRTMFLQLSEILVAELQEGRSVQTIETFDVMKRVQEEIILLEERRGISLN
jgi:hypothetical protein